MILQWAILHANLDPIHGREQAGDRSVLVISAEPLNERYDVVTTIPLTSRKAARQARLGEVLLPAGVAGLKQDSFVLCYQARALDKSRLGRLYGHITDEHLKMRIQSMLAECLDIGA
jgi:mRNA interferase MazF